MILRGAKWNTVVMILCSNGKQYYIAGAKWGDNRRIALLEGANGLLDLTYDAIVAESARQSGNTYLDRTMHTREIDLPLFIDGDSSAHMVRTKTEFLRDVLNGEFRLCFFNPTYGWRWINLRSHSYTTMSDLDASARGYEEIVLTCTAHDPRYKSWTDRQRVNLSDATEVEITNRGDSPVFPDLVFGGNLGVEYTIETPELPPVALPRIARGDESLLVQTDPGKRRIFSSVRGSLPWTDTAYKRIDLSVQPGETKKFAVGVKGGTPVPGVNYVQVFTPQYYYVGY